MTWQPTSIIREPWGRFQVIVGGQDVSFFRGVPTVIESFASSEPFGDDTAAISFQQITPFEPLGQGDLSWFYPWAPVEIYCVKPDGSRLPVLFEGEFPSLEDSFDETWATSMNCLGVLHLLRNFRDRPNFKIQEKDIGLQIADAINARIDVYGLRLQYASRNLTGISQLVTGTWTNDIETGTFQTLLSKATVSILPTRGAVTVDIAARPNGLGYWLLSDDGTVVPYGPGTPYYGSMVNVPENGVPVAIESTATGLGYWIASSDGGVFSFGDAGFYGSQGGSVLNQPIVDMKHTDSGNGYWLLGGDGGVFNFGDASYWGSLPGDGFSFTDVIAIMPTPAGDGYSILRTNGAMYNYGSVPVRPPVAITYSGQRFVDMELRPAGTGYWVLDALGNVYSFEGAPYEGGAGGLTLAAPMRRMAPRDAGYWLQAEDGGIFSYGALAFWGSTPGAMGNFNQWTLMNEPGRRPVVRLKDLWTPHWSMRVGTPGLVARLSTDYTQAVDVSFGEGVDPDGCFPEGTRVFAEDIESVFRRPWTKGLIHVLVSDGRHLAVTPNHPILTPEGWVAARLLQPGSKIISHPKRDAAADAEPHVIDAPSPIDEVFRTASKLGISERVPAVGVHFHGDVADREIEVVRPDSELWDDLEPLCFEHSREPSFFAADHAEIPLSTECHACSLLGRVTAAGGGVRSGGHGVPLGGRHPSFRQHERLAHRANRDAVPVQDEPHGVVRNADGLGDVVSGLPAHVATDDVVFVYFDSAWTGDVYNLQTRRGWYYANDVVVHNCWWRNTKYPGARHGDPPLWFREIKLGTAGSDVTQWEQEMSDKGWGLAVDGVYGTDDRDVCYTLQTQAGLALTGTVTAQTWAVTFDIGNIGTDPYFMPLAQDADLEPYLYNANGEPIGLNPSFDSRKTRIESFESYGANTTKAEGVQAARSTINRFNRHLPDGTLVADPGVTGSLTLTVDPAEGSRFEIRAGQNFLLQSYRGQDVLLHIAHAEHKPSDLTTDLTVDQKAHDLMTLGAIMERDKIATDLAKRPYLQPITSAMSPDGPVWDCENNAGVIPRHAIQSRLWNVLRIPAGQRGSIAQAEFFLDLPVEFSVALFAAPVTHAMLASAMPSGPLTPMADGKNPWQELPDDLVPIYIDAWGSPDQPAGYFPGTKSNGDAVTGVMKDNGGVNYESQDVPWIYLAVWCATTTYVRGQLHPGLAGF